MEVNTMSKKFEYIIVILLAGLLVILFRWPENGRYELREVDTTISVIDTRSGDIWVLAGKEKKWLILPSIHK